MFALVDCNSFYASCEKVFDPKVRNRPVVVLSNNDGCVVAACKQAKALGVGMFGPAFQMADTFRKHNVAVFSSNYTLYQDMSNRVMRTLEMYAPGVEVYSIDESFLTLHSIPPQQLRARAELIREKVLEFTGLGVGVGVAPTKTLTKVANKLAKRADGIWIIDSEESRVDALRRLPIEDVWGVGHRWAPRFQALGIRTAFDLASMPLGWIRKHKTVVGERLWRELNGEPCYGLLDGPPRKQMIATTRSFPGTIGTYEELAEAVTGHARECARKLRKQNSKAGTVYLFLRTDPFKDTYHRKTGQLLKDGFWFPVILPVASNDDFTIVEAALRALKLRMRPGYPYKKAGVLVGELRDAEPTQLHFWEQPESEARENLMKTLDKLGQRYGRQVVRVASQEGTQKHVMRREKLSPRYTTNLAESPKGG